MSTKSISEYIKQMRKKHNLTLNSKKSKIKRSDFKIAMSSDGLEEAV